MFAKLRFVCSLLSLLTLVAAARLPADEPATDGKTPSPPRVLVTISKETTYITGPLRKDGYVDYIAALNERWSKGVTPENNSAVLFWQAMGPAEIDARLRDEYFRLLEAPQPPAKGDYFIPMEKYVEQLKAHQAGATLQSEKEIDAANEFYESGDRRPWSKREFPVLADWLAANEKPLALMVEASHRPRRFDPLIAGGPSPLLGALLPAAQHHREIANALVLRAMLRVDEGKFDAAWDDLMAVHRLARLVAAGPTLIEGLVGIALEGMACAGDEGLLRGTRLTTAQATEMLGDLRKLGRVVKMVDKIDTAERFMFLDSVADVARNGSSGLTQLTGAVSSLSGDGPARKTAAQKEWDAMSASVDWDIVLRMGNAWYDRMVAAAGKPTRGERIMAMRTFDRDLREMAAGAKDWASLIFPYLANPRKAVSQRMGQIFVALLLPALDTATVAEDRGVMQLEVTKLGFALAAFRADHGAYPAKLAELVPKYVAEVPQDVFSEADLRYRLDGDGYLLYSVGMNGHDDGGRGYADDKTGEGWDDLVVRVPDSAKTKRPVPEQR